jgi:putative two-component system response regulator
MAELLIVDDDDTLRRWAEQVVQERGYSCDGAHNAVAAREQLQRSVYKLVLLHVNMSGESGIDLLAHIRSHHPGAAVLIVTGEDDPRLAMAAIEHGVYGYMVKPIDSGELLIHVASALHRRRRELERRRLNQRLQATANDHSERLESALRDLRLSETEVWTAQAETIFRLARLVELRGEETDHHLRRMSSFCEILARKAGFSEQHCELIRLASQLHDLGKVAIPDGILLKHGRLTPDEFEIIKGHAEAGYRMLAGSSSEIVQLGAVIARTHHERWDGSGYPRDLAGKDIPPEGRIAAIADAFDALTSDRVYRSAFPVKSAIETMQSERGTHFDPELLDAFIEVLGEIEAIRQTYLD